MGAPVTDLVRLSAGASRETWSFCAGRPLILQRHTARSDDLRLSVDAQTEVMSAAHAVGVPVPLIVAADADSMIVEQIPGETIARKILRDEGFADARAALTKQCAQALTRIHAIPRASVGSLGDGDQLAAFRSVLDQVQHPYPALELAFRWLELRRPARTRTTVVHGDFRLGNFVVGPEGLRAVLDWELAHIGDPLEDLGWLCVTAWRFGAAAPVGGFGTRDQLFAAYEDAAETPVDRDAVHWWEIFGNLRWAVICIVQAQRHLSGRERSVELATIGRRVAEVEQDLFELLP